MSVRAYGVPYIYPRCADVHMRAWYRHIRDGMCYESVNNYSASTSIYEYPQLTWVPYYPLTYLSSNV